jgi:hypothetical protein
MLGPSMKVVAAGHLLVLARLSDFEAELVQHSSDRIAESKALIARSEILLYRR